GPLDREADSRGGRGRDARLRAQPQLGIDRRAAGAIGARRRSARHRPPGFGYPEVGAVITGVHAIVFAEDADAVRTFLRETLELASVDAGGGWLIFALPPAEIAAHPTAPDDSGRHRLYLMCDDIHATVAELTA